MIRFGIEDEHGQMHWSVLAPMSASLDIKETKESSKLYPGEMMMTVGVIPSANLATSTLDLGLRYDEDKELVKIDPQFRDDRPWTRLFNKIKLQGRYKQPGEFIKVAFDVDGNITEHQLPNNFK